ncbi:MAG: response regulator [Lentisphaeraceae bacterium]|nr:response regulator [Lentisphaeraceae bacterium]
MNPCILVIDDEPVIQEVLKCLLENKGYMAEKCMDGKEAFQAMEEVEFNLVILDLNLPDIYGLEIAAHLEKHHPNTPIIFITGDHSADAMSLQEECKTRDDRQFLQKPITSDALYGAIESLVEDSVAKGSLS